MVRDVLHALLVPVVELFDKASSLAASATCATKAEHLEYAFSGPARSAFTWLQCFLAGGKEREWCYTRGCPVCVADHSLYSEFSIRLLFAACLLSDVHYPFTLEGPTLPSFTFFLDSLERALAGDPLYGKDFFDLTQPKAIATRNGIEDLIYQCIELDVIFSRPSSQSGASSSTSSGQAVPVPGQMCSGPMDGSPVLKGRRSKLARRQMKLEIEEERWTEEKLKRCRDQLQPETERGRTLSQGKYLDAVLKVAPTVTIKEVNRAG